MSKENLPFKTYRARRRPWDRFKKTRFDELRADSGAASPGERGYPPPPPAPGRGATARPVQPSGGGPRPADPNSLHEPVAPSPRRSSPATPRRPSAPRRTPRPRRPSLVKIAKYFAIWVVAWLVISAVLFTVSASIESGGITSATNAELGGGGNFVTAPGTVLVLGLDRRPRGSKEPGASTIVARSDSMMLLRTGGGKSRRLSILRDSYTQIPGYQPQKINAAYAFGGAALTVRTVDQFLGNGLKINHIVIIDFAHFPGLIDALGGITVKVSERCIHSTFGGKTFSLRRGEHHLNGDQALGFSRVRKNACNPAEDDRDRARRQQQVMSAMKSKAFSPFTFLRLPWVTWAAPKAIITDMSPVTLMGFLSSMSLGANPSTEVLTPSGLGPGGSLIVSDAERARAVNKFLH